MLPAVLHVTSAPGGGIDRYVRDIAAHVPGTHRALHVGPAIDVLEDFEPRHYAPMPAAHPEAIARIAAATGLLHAHGVEAANRARVARVRAVRHLPLVVTLHDLAFLDPGLFIAQEAVAPDPAWIDGVHAYLAGASCVLAPSRFIAEAAAAAMPGIAAQVVRPGIAAQAASPAEAAPQLPEAFVARRKRHVVAVIGAIGPHKGSALLRPLAAGLDAHDANLVVIGYTDQRITPGWDGHGLYVHGPYRDEALASWLSAYAPAVVLFPNRIPESFSYTLSETWAAGVPVIVPEEGALGERVRLHGGGWTLPPRFGVAEVLALTLRLLGDAAELGRVKSVIVAADPDRVPPLDAMTDAVSCVYRHFGAAPSGGDDAVQMLAALQPLLAANLDGFTFREELLNLCGQVESRERALAEARAWADKLGHDIAAANRWATKLAADVAELRSEVGARDAAIQGLSGERDALKAEAKQLALQAVALERLPRWIRQVLTARAERAQR